MSETWKDKLTARLAELDQQIAALDAERAEVRQMLGVDPKSLPYGSGPKVVMELLSDGKPHSLRSIVHQAGLRYSNTTMCMKRIGAIRVSRGVYRMPDGGWPAETGAPK